MKELLRFKNEFVVLALLGVMFFIGKGFVSAYSLQMQDIDVKQRDFKNHSDILSRWQKAASDYHKGAGKFIFSDASEFKRFVDEQAQSQGVNISYIGPSRQDRVYYEEATMNMKIATTYKNFANFIRSLEAKDVIVDRMTVKNTASRPGDKKGRAIDVAIRVFVPKK